MVKQRERLEKKLVDALFGVSFICVFVVNDSGQSTSVVLYLRVLELACQGRIWFHSGNNVDTAIKLKNWRRYQ